MKASRLWQLLATPLVAVAFLAFFFRGVRFDELLNDLRDCTWQTFLAIGALAVTAVWIRALRWRLILKRVPGADKRGLFPITMIGFMLNNLLPAHIGEAARVLLLWKKKAYSPFIGIGSIIVEKILDFTILGAFFVVPALYLGSLEQYRGVAVIVVGGITLVIACFVLHALAPNLFVGVMDVAIGQMPRRFRPHLTRALRELMSNMDWAYTAPKIAPVILLSIALETCYVLTIGLASGNQGIAGVLESMFIQVLSSIGAGIPFTIGYIGTVHAAVLQAFIILGEDAHRGRAVAIITHAASFVPVVLLGLFFLIRTGVSFREIRESKKAIDEKVEEVKS